MVLGAGLGTRLRPFTNRIPKPLLPVLGVPCIQFALSHLAEFGVEKAVVNTHAHAEKLRSYLTSAPVPKLSLIESNEEAQLLGSAGGFQKALPLFDQNAFFSMNADVIHFLDLEALHHAHARFKKERGVLMTLVLASPEVSTKQEGEYTEILKSGSEGLVAGLGTKTRGRPFYTGSAIFEKEAFSRVPKNMPSEFVPTVLAPMIEAKKVAFIESQALWIDIRSPELWARAHHTLSEAQAQSLLSTSVVQLLKSFDPTCHGQFELGKHHIRLEDIEYEIKDIGNP